MVVQRSASAACVEAWWLSSLTPIGCASSRIARVSSRMPRRAATAASLSV